MHTQNTNWQKYWDEAVAGEDADADAKLEEATLKYARLSGLC